jgi:hypothetical protein
MSLCNICGASNQDSALACRVCKSPLGKTQLDVKAGTIGTPPRRETVRETTADNPFPKPISRPASTPPPDASKRRVTIFDPSLAEAPADKGKAAPLVQSASPARKIVGVLVTYSWTDQGQIFPVYEGRNRIGSDPAQCDIAVPQDDTLSAINSHIVFRKNFTIGDDVSMGGTDVDGEPVETAFVPLRNYARIRTGSTHWTFIAVQPQAAEE